MVQRNQEIRSLKEQLDAAFVETGTVAAEIGASNGGGRIEGVTAQLAEAIKTKESLEEELTEFAEYTVSLPSDVVSRKECFYVRRLGELLRCWVLFSLPSLRVERKYQSLLSP